jgi:glycosyltransferase involved in cell wall biosynthesis
LAILGILLAAIPAGLFLANLPLFVLRPAIASVGRESPPAISVLIPARDEQSGIEDCLRTVLASRGVTTEVVVLDDQSTDRTAEIVQALADDDDRVRCIAGKPLPGGWNGKQFACYQLAEAAAKDRWLFMDADVRLQPDALRTLADYQDANRLELLSAFPHQQTKTWLEKWLVPMMHVVLLGYLPLRRMRSSSHEAYSAGCGQLFMTNREGYRTAGTHEAIKSSRHDGLKLPRAYRSVGLMTDVVDGTDLASCRMYDSTAAVIRGVLKNAHEGIANPRLILPFSVLLLGASVLPVVTLVISVVTKDLWAGLASIVGVVLGHLPRILSAIQFRQSIFGVVFHSLATLLFVILQWVALVMHAMGRSVAWRGRTET